MRIAVCLKHCILLCAMPFAMLYGSGLLACPSYSGGPFNLGGFYEALLGASLLFLAQTLVCIFYPVTSKSSVRRIIHFGCWLGILEGMLYPYIKFPYNIEYIRYPKDLHMWFPADEYQIYFILCMSALSFYMGIADIQKNQLKLMFFSLLSHFTAFNILGRLIDIFVYQM